MSEPSAQFQISAIWPIGSGFPLSIVWKVIIALLASRWFGLRLVSVQKANNTVRDGFTDLFTIVHQEILIAAKESGIDDVRQVKYIAFAGGGEAVTQLLAGSLQAFTGDLSEAQGFVESGDIKVIALLAPERLEGEFSSFPTAREQGIDAIGANWRGFYAPGNMSDEAYAYWVERIDTLYDTPEWKAVMESNGLAPLDLHGPEFQEFVANSVDSIQTLSREIGILK